MSAVIGHAQEMIEATALRLMPLAISLSENFNIGCFVDIITSPQCLVVKRILHLNWRTSFVWLHYHRLRNRVSKKPRIAPGLGAVLREADRLNTGNDPP